MQQKITVITIGVNDLEKSKHFYAHILGWKEKDRGNTDIAFYQTENLGVILSLYPKEEMAKDVGLANNGQGFPNFALALNVNSKQEVDEIISDLKSKKVEIVKEPNDTSWGGYSAYFKDPDGYLWDIAYNPFWKTDANGKIDLSDVSAI